MTSSEVRSGAIGTLLALMAIIAFFTVGCEKVEPGWAAVKVNQYGGDRGVQKEPITTGVIWYFRPTTDLYQFPTFTQTANWTAAEGDEKSAGNDSVTFNSTEGATMNTDISIAYHFQLAKVPELFESFRTDAEGITHGFVIQRIRDHFVQSASQMTASEIMGPGKVKLLTSVKTEVNKELNQRGIVVEQLSFYGDMRIDDRVRHSVNAVIEARQLAEKTRQQVEQEKAEADKKVAQARGHADSLKLRADAEAYANAKISESLTPTVMQFRSLEKWNGVLPTVMGGNGGTPFITLPAAK